MVKFEIIIHDIKSIEHTLGLLECSTLLVMLSERSNVFLNNGASSSSSDLFIPLYDLGEFAT